MKSEQKTGGRPTAKERPSSAKAKTPKSPGQNSKTGAKAGAPAVGRKKETPLKPAKSAAPARALRVASTSAPSRGAKAGAAAASRDKPASVRALAQAETRTRPKKNRLALPEKNLSRSRKPLVVPPVLLEGDLPPAPPVSGPGSRYALTAEALIPHVASSTGELPESYGTQNLFLAARDPHWLFASWDLSDEQQRNYNKRSRDARLLLRVFASGEPKPVVPEVQVHPESRSWFVHVPYAERLYHAELGYYAEKSNWNSVAISKSTFTPPDAPAPEVSQEFATIPPEITFQQIVEAVQSFVTENEPLLEAVIKASAPEARVQAPAPQREEASIQKVSETAAESYRQETAAPKNEAKRAAREVHQAAAAPDSAIPSVQPVPPVSHPNGMVPSRSFRAELPVRVERQNGWSSEQAKAVARLINVDSYRRVWMGSMEITELIRRKLQEDLSSIAAAELAQGRAEAQPGERGILEGAPSSLLLGEKPEKGRGFWFKVNAELIIYGSTEPDATVTIADREIKLRPDGSFSFRFSLPDGRYQLPAVAISSAGDDGREARLEFSRSTEYHGQVEVHPQDAALRPPKPESIG